MLDNDKCQWCTITKETLEHIIHQKMALMRGLVVDRKSYYRYEPNPKQSARHSVDFETVKKKRI